MYITRKGQYALFFMINLAIHAGETVPVKQAAKEYDLSEKYLEQVGFQTSSCRSCQGDPRQPRRLLSCEAGCPIHGSGDH